jgi:hypothetical protein
MHGKSKEGEQVQCVVVRVQGEVFVSRHPKNAAAMRENILKVFFTLLFLELTPKFFLLIYAINFK